MTLDPNFVRDQNMVRNTRLYTRLSGIRTANRCRANLGANFSPTKTVPKTRESKPWILRSVVHPPYGYSFFSIDFVDWFRRNIFDFAGKNWIRKKGYFVILKKVNLSRICSNLILKRYRIQNFNQKIYIRRLRLQCHFVFPVISYIPSSPQRSSIVIERAFGNHSSPE